MARIQTTHVGSLVRPDELIAFLRQFDKKDPAYDEAAHMECLARSVQGVVAKQKEVGVDIVSDGEYGKTAWNYYVYERLGGIELRPHPPGEANFASVNENPTDWARFHEFYAEYFAKEQDYESPGGDWACVGEVTTPAATRSTATSPTSRRRWRPTASPRASSRSSRPASCFPNLIDEHYGSEDAALMGIAEALREEYKAIVDAGLYVQIDDAYIPFMYDVIVPPGTMADYKAWAQPRIDALNHALEGIPEDRVRYHVCWGSWNGPHTGDIALKDVLDLMFQVKAKTFLFENANPRHEHEWRVWEDAELPAGKILAPGVISHATNVVEHPELVAERIERIARLVGPENVIASTDCGFAQGPYLQRVHESIQWAKLDSLAQGAKLASGALAAV